MGHRVGYIRVSTLDQSTERQLEGVELDKVFTDKASGKDLNRPQLKEAIEYVRRDDTLVVHSMDRLARNVEGMLRLVRELNDKGVAVEFVKENMSFTGKDDPRSMLMFTMLGAFAQFERSLIKERQREGIALAKRKGVYKGRQRSLSAEEAKQLREKARESWANKTQLAKEYGISRETLYSYLRTT